MMIVEEYTNASMCFARRRNARVKRFASWKYINMSNLTSEQWATIFLRVTVRLRGGRGV